MTNPRAPENTASHHRARWGRICFLLLGWGLMVSVFRGQSDSGLGGVVSWIYTLSFFALIPSYFVIWRQWGVHWGWKLCAVGVAYFIGTCLMLSTMFIASYNLELLGALLRSPLSQGWNLLMAGLLYAPILAMLWHAPHLPVFTLRTPRLT